MWVIIGIVSVVVLILLFNDIGDRKLLETVTQSNRGTGSERKLVVKLLKHGIPAQTIFHDLYLKKPNGTFSQIDLVIATSVGIIVIEVKDFSGWIFGAGNQTQWTQVLAYGKSKFRLYNPILQNSKHVSDLRMQLRQFETVPFYSIVVFYGNCILKDIKFVPQGTFVIKANRVTEVIETIKKDSRPAHYNNKREVVDLLKAAIKNGEDKETRDKHVENVRNMLGKDSRFIS